MNSFIISRNNHKTNDKQPDYRISVKHNDNWLTVGGAWLKEGKNGKYFSCKLQDKPYNKKDGSVVPAFRIVEIAEGSDKVMADPAVDRPF